MAYANNDNYGLGLNAGTDLLGGTHSAKLDNRSGEKRKFHVRPLAGSIGMSKGPAPELTASRDGGLKDYLYNKNVMRRSIDAAGLKGDQKFIKKHVESGIATSKS